jgi:MFS family permease
MIRRLFQVLLPVDRFTKGDRRVTATIWLAGVIQGFAQSQVSATLPFTRAGLGLTESEMSLLVGLARLAAFIALPLGWMGDRRGRRRPFLVAMTLIVLGGTGAGLAFDAFQFGAAHAVLRTGTAAVAGLAVVILAETVSPAIRSYAISFYGAAVSFGAGLAIMVLPFADDGGDSWRIPHLLTALGLLLIPLLVKRVPETPIFRHDHEHTPWTALARGPWASRFWKVAAIGFLASAYGTFVTAFTTERLVTHVGLATGTTVIVVLIGGTAGGIGFFVGGHVSDRWGRRSTSIVAMVLGAIGGVTLYSVTSLPAIIGAVLVSTFGTFALVPAGGAHRAELFPTGLRSSAGTAAANFSLAGAAAGLMAGIVTITAFGLEGTVYVLAVGVVLAAALTASLPETRGQDLTAVSTADR